MHHSPFTKYIIKTDGATLDDAEDLDLVMLVYNLLEYSSNHSDTTDSLWFYSKDETISFNNTIVDANAFKFFKYKNKLIGSTDTIGILENATYKISM